MDKLRFKYFLKTLFVPKSWVRLHKTDKDWDKELWESIQNLNNFTAVGSHNAIINDKIVWIENYPYASGQLSENGYGSKGPSCSRTTALFLQTQVEKARIILLLKGKNETQSDTEIHEQKYLSNG